MKIINTNLFFVLITIIGCGNTQDVTQMFFYKKCKSHSNYVVNEYGDSINVSDLDADFIREKFHDMDSLLNWSISYGRVNRKKHGIEVSITASYVKGSDSLKTTVLVSRVKESELLLDFMDVHNDFNSNYLREKVGAIICHFIRLEIYAIDRIDDDSSGITINKNSPKIIYSTKNEVRDNAIKLLDRWYIFSNYK